MTTARALAALALAATLTLAGCTDDPEPLIADPTESPTQSESSAPSESPTRATERELIEQFFSEVSESISSGDSSAWQELTRDCTNCETLARNLREAYADGGRIEGGKWTLLNLEFAGAVDLGAEWNVEVKTSKERWLSASGDLVKTVRASNQEMAVAVDAMSGGHALITGLRTRS